MFPLFCTHCGNKTLYMKSEDNREKIESIKKDLKIALLSSILEGLNGVKLSSFYEEKEDGIHIDVSLFPIHIEQEEKTIIIKQKKKHKQGPVYRSVKNVKIEEPAEQEEKVKKAEEQFENIVLENFAVSLKSSQERFSQLFEEIKNNRMYKKFIVELKELRSKILGNMPLSEYVSMVKEHVNTLETIFSEKKYDSKKKILSITQALSSLDQRLIFYNKYFESQLEPDEIQHFDNAIKVNMSVVFPKRYITFSHGDIYDRMFNYSVAIFPLTYILKNSIANPYGFSNIVYLPLDKSNIEDPYSFYILEKIDDKRYWKMEIRLDDFSKVFSVQILNYCVTLFRRIYYDIFSDNVYREDYQSKASIASQDCQQLLQNIINLSKQKSFCQLLQQIVMKYCEIEPTKMDKFNLTGDDKINKKQFQKEKDEKEKSLEVIKRVFDEISDEDAENIL